MLPRSRRSRALRGLCLLVPARAFSLSVPPTLPSVVSGLEAYSALLVAHPLETKVGTAAVLAVAGDAIAQRRSEAPYDRARAASFVLFDAAYRGGFQHFAFPWIIDHCRGDTLEAATSSLSLSGPFADQSLLAAVECTAVNQLLIVPVVYYPLFFAITGTVQGLSGAESLERARGSFVDLTLRNWRFWVPAQFCQFAYLPEEWQVPYTCAMGLVWNVILSAAAGSAREPTPAQPPAAPLSKSVVGVVRRTKLPAAKEAAKRS